MQNSPAPQVRFGEWITEGWRMFAEQWATWVLMTLTFFLVIMVPIAVIFAVFAFLSAAVVGLGEPTGVLVIYPAMFVGFIVVAPFIVFLNAGMHKASLKQLRGGKIKVSDLFSAGDHIFSLLGAAIAVGVLAMIGFLFCLIPGYIVMGLLYFTSLLIIDRDLGASDAMSESYRLTRPNMWMFTLFVFVVGILAQIGTYACYIGILATYPLQFTISAVAYRDCFGVAGARSFTAPTAGHAPSYGSPQPDWRVPSCVSCNASLPQGATFCPACGARNEA